MTAMGLRATSPVLVGRQGEIARLVEALDVAADGGSAVALVAGEAGSARPVWCRSSPAVPMGVGSGCVSGGAWIWGRRSGRWRRCARSSPDWSTSSTATRSIC